MNTGLSVEFPSGKSCLFAGVALNSGSGQSLNMNGSNWAIPPNSKFGIQVSGYQPHLDKLYVSGGGNITSQTTVVGALNTSVTQAKVVNGGAGGAAGM